MCGIIGFLGKQNSIPFLIQGLKLLQNRGYDSAGISVLADHIHTIKYASTDSLDSIKKLEENIALLPEEHHSGIAHTRWATHGRKTDENAHPHHSMDKTISVVHNGIIENYLQLREFLTKEGYIFSSTTDTEAIAQLFQYYLSKHELIPAIENLCNTLNGTWACLIQCEAYPTKLIALRNGSPLLFSKNENGYYFTSEVSGFQNKVDTYRITTDKSYYICDYMSDQLITKEIKHGIHYNELDSNVHQIDKQLIDLSPDPYPHWMIKEIYDQISASSRAINNGGRLSGEIGIKLGGLEDHRDILLKYKKICFLGCGTSLHAGMYGSVYFNRFGIQTRVCDASEFYEYNIDSDSLYIVLSQSGETKDVHRAMELIQKRGGVIVAVVNVVESLIAREAMCGVYINAGSEKAVASTKSFTNQVIVLCLIAMWFYKNWGSYTQELDDLFSRLRSDLLELSDAIRMTIDSCVKPVRKIAEVLHKKEHMFLLGRGSLYPIGLEGALKIKEISYIHAEGFCGGALKHGPFALIEEETPIFILSNDDSNAQRMESAGEEVSCRGAHAILITNESKLFKNTVYKYMIPVVKLKELSSLLIVIPFQLLCYEIGLKKGVSVDQPKSLAKVVTVDG
jgi:glucosamine--fructose-6-phosphate aminotransferase (isomerizing)